MVFSKGCHGFIQGLTWFYARVAVVLYKGCRGFLQELPWFYTRVAVVFSVIAKVKSTPSPRPKTGVRQKFLSHIWDIFD